MQEYRFVPEPVGKPVGKNILADLRNTLSPDIYLFINAMRGLMSPLSTEDVSFFYSTG